MIILASMTLKVLYQVQDSQNSTRIIVVTTRVKIRVVNNIYYTILHCNNYCFSICTSTPAVSMKDRQLFTKIMIPNVANFSLLCYCSLFHFSKSHFIIGVYYTIFNCNNYGFSIFTSASAISMNNSCNCLHNLASLCSLYAITIYFISLNHFSSLE
jgi:hypothetical protein